MKDSRVWCRDEPLLGVLVQGSVYDNAERWDECRPGIGVEPRAVGKGIPVRFEVAGDRVVWLR